ncbi:MAG: BrnT family toxin [Chloroflexi bacterium]|nr:BrnT family toxin [Chloroflexota bacterium]MBI3741088.1 BrnT family toxin [Chloroflexota bacterium]
MEFKWDPQKAAKNLRKHKVSFKKGATLFNDPLSATVPDPDHSDEEGRYIIVGISNRFRQLIVSFAEQGDRIRITPALACGASVSARELTRAERKAYEKETP